MERRILQIRMGLHVRELGPSPSSPFATLAAFLVVWRR